MKILYIVSSPELNPHATTGYARHINESIRYFEKQGHEVVLFTTKKWSAKPAFEESSRSASKHWIKALVPQVLWNTLRDVRLLLQLRSLRQEVQQIITSEQVDFIYERDAYLVDFVPLMKSVSVTWFLEVNAPILEERARLSGCSLLFPLAFRREKEKLKAAERIFTVSQRLKEHICETFEINEREVVVNPNGVDLNRFKLGLNEYEEVFDFGFVGSILPFHGVDRLLNAFVEVHRCHPGTRLLIVGDGAQLNELKDMARRSGIYDSVMFQGPVSPDSVGQFIGQMKVCIMPDSNWYGSPVKIFEYGALAKAVIAPRVGPVQEIITHREDGILVSSESELISAMLKLIDDHQLALQIGQNLYERVANNFTWEKNAQRILSKLDS